MHCCHWLHLSIPLKATARSWGAGALLPTLAEAACTRGGGGCMDAPRSVCVCVSVMCTKYYLKGSNMISKHQLSSLHECLESEHRRLAVYQSEYLCSIEVLRGFYSALWSVISPAAAHQAIENLYYGEEGVTLCADWLSLHSLCASFVCQLVTVFRKHESVSILKMCSSLGRVHQTL